jgi:hypothetical protein
MSSIKAMLELLTAQGNLSSLPKPSAALSVGTGTGNRVGAASAPNTPSYIGSLAASVGISTSSTNNIRRAPIRISTTSPNGNINSVDNQEESEVNQENDNLIDVDLNGNIEPSAKDISEANKELVGPSQVKSIQANHFGGRMVEIVVKPPFYVVPWIAF